MSQKIKVLINDVEVQDFLIKYSISRSCTDSVASGQLTFTDKVNDVLIIENGFSVEIWRGIEEPDNIIFKGFVVKVAYTGTRVEIQIRDKLDLLYRKIINKVYLDTDSTEGKLVNIFKDILDLCGLSYDNTTIQESDAKVSKFLCKDALALDRCRVIADALNWQFYYRPDTDKVYFEPKGYVQNTNILKTSENILEVPKWDEDASDLFNYLKVEGSYQLVETTETFNGNGSQKEFFVTKIPESTKVYIGTTLKKGEIEGSSASADYYVDKTKKRIRFVTAPPSGTNNVIIHYSYLIPTPIVVWNSESIAKYGRIEKKITLTDVKSTADAEVRAEEILGMFSKVFLSTTLKVMDPISLNLFSGQTIKVIDEINEIEDYFVIYQHTMLYPETYDEIKIGNKLWSLDTFLKSVAERIKRLEEQLSGETDYVLNVVSAIKDFELKPRYAKVLMRSVSGESLVWNLNDWNEKKWLFFDSYSFIIGSSIAGILGTNRLGERSGDWIEVQIVYPNNEYFEQFEDEDFKDEETTAYWNTTDKRLEFEGNEWAYSKTIFINDKPINAVYIEVKDEGNISGYYLSNDNGETWEKVDKIDYGEGVKSTIHYFTSSGRFLRWKVNAVGTWIYYIKIKLI